MPRCRAADYLFLVRFHDALSDCVGFAASVGQLLPLIDIPSDTHRYSGELGEYLDTERGSTVEIPQSEKASEVGKMGTDKKTQIRIIKQGMAGNSPESQAVSGERRKKDAMAEVICSVSGWVAKFKGRRLPDPRIIFQTLFKQV